MTHPTSEWLLERERLAAAAVKEASENPYTMIPRAWDALATDAIESMPILTQAVREQAAELDRLWSQVASQTTELVNLGQAHGVLLTERSDLTDEVRKLRAVVERLPKTADGVQVLQDEFVSVLNEDGTITDKTAGTCNVGHDCRLNVPVREGEDARLDHFNWKIYSTREAAAAALAGGTT